MTSITPVRSLLPVTPAAPALAPAAAAPAPTAAPAAPAAAAAATTAARQGAVLAAAPAPSTAPKSGDRSGRLTAGELKQAVKGALGRDPKAQVAVDKTSNTATLVSGDFTFDVKPGAAGQPVDVVARAFFKEHGNLFGVKDAASQLRLVQTDKDAIGYHHFRYQQYYNELPVFGQQLVVHTQGATVHAAGGHVVPNINLTVDEAADIKVGDALKAIQASFTGKDAVQLTAKNAGTLGVYPTNDGVPHLAYEMDVQSVKGPESWRYYVDAESGKVLDSWSTLETALNRETYDAKSGQSRPGTIKRREGDGPNGDASVDAAHDNAKAVFDYYNTNFGRDSIDDHGMKIISTVHFGDKYNNAFWDGSQMTYGDGDGKLLSPLALGVDVVGHEMTHGVTERTAGLQYRSQSGALNESWSDVMGNLIQKWAAHQKDPNAAEVDPKWLVGEDVFTPGVDGDAIRSMSAPGTAYKGDPQPATMKDYKNTGSDNGGVHINSGIPNKAAYLVGTSIGTDKLGKIWYRTQTTYLTPTSKFQDAANFTAQAAADLFGKDSAEVKAVKDAWNQVGLPVA